MARPGSTPIVVAALAVLGLTLIGLPLAGLLTRVPWSRAPAVLAAPRSLTALRLSLEVSVAAALLSIALGAPVAWILARTDVRATPLIRALAVLPLVLPPVVGGVALLAALGRNGVAGRLLARIGIELPFTTTAAVLTGTFVAFPLVVLAVESGLRSLDPRLERAAATMGASDWYTLRRVTVPLLRPQLGAAFVLAWARALGEFGATIIFAGNLRGRTQTMPLAVFETLQTDPGGAITQSLLLVALSLVALVLLRDRLLPGGRT